MTRPLRIEYEGALYHVMNRGINHQDIFLTNYHREMFLALLEEISIKFYVEIHSFCLMRNHYHILIRTPLPNLGKAMRHLDGLYTRRFNISEKRDGSIFKGRYKAILIEKETYLLQVSRYIHLNPVEARICSDPIDYPWSSYAYLIKEYKKFSWIKIDLILSHFDNRNRYNLYREYVEQGIDKEIVRLYKKSSPIFSSAHFIKKMLASITARQKTFSASDIRRASSLPTIQHISRSVAQYFSVKVEDLKISKKGKDNLPRNIAIFLSRRAGQCNHQEISEHFTNLTVSSVSTAIKRFEKNYASSVEIKIHLDKLSKILIKMF